MRPDYFVSFKSLEAIADIATRWRKEARLEHNYCFDMTNFLVKCLSRRYLQKGLLEVIFFNQKSDEPPAYVKYNPLRLFVDQEIWIEARFGEPMARFILAHEVGHILLHDHNAQSFSDNPALRLKFPRKENGSEWQADTFASYFLISDEQVLDFQTASDLAIRCSVPIQLATERFDYANLRRRKRGFYAGDICSECGNFTLIRKGISTECDTCGTRAAS